MKSQGPHDAGPKLQPYVTACRWEGQLGTHVPTHPNPLDRVRHFSSRGVPLLMTSVAVAGRSTAASQDLCSWASLLGPSPGLLGPSLLMCHSHGPSKQPRGGQGSACGRTAVPASAQMLGARVLRSCGCPAGGCCWGWRGVLGTAGACPHIPAEVLLGGCA